MLNAFTSIRKWVTFLFVWLIFLLMWMNNCSFLPHSHVFPWQNSNLFQQIDCVFSYSVLAPLKRNSCTASQHQKAQHRSTFQCFFNFCFPGLGAKANPILSSKCIFQAYTQSVFAKNWWKRPDSTCWERQSLTDSFIRDKWPF